MTRFRDTFRRFTARGRADQHRQEQMRQAQASLGGWEQVAEQVAKAQGARTTRAPRVPPRDKGLTLTPCRLIPLSQPQYKGARSRRLRKFRWVPA